MKSLFLLGLVFLFSFANKPVHKVLPDEEATIYIYRAGQFMAAGNNWAMYLDGKKICKLSNNKFIKVTVPKGKHSITSQIGGIGLFKKETEIEIDAEAGQSYYIACNVKQSFTRARLEMLEVTKSTADKQMKDMTLDNCQEKIDEETNKN
jgi:formylmethanofuran dehydrogenase subunit D